MTRPLRVLLLCDRLHQAGGVERFVCTLANHLATEGLDVAVGSVDTPREQIHYTLHERVRVLNQHSVRPEVSKAPPSPFALSLARPEPVEGSKGRPNHTPPSRLARAWAILRTQWQVATTLARLIRHEQPDVIVLNGLTTACSVLVRARRFSPRVICCDHNHFNARSRWWQALRTNLYPRVAAVVSLTQTDAAHFAALNPRTEVIYNAAALHADVPAAPLAPVVLAVGRHVEQKGLDLLLAAWPTVAQACPEARLRIVGDGPLREALHAQAQALGVTVEWLPPTPHIEALYREAAVFALPSRDEGMPLALLEAQALGVPAVAFDCPTGPSEILTPETGRLVPLGDVPALAAALVELLRDPALRARMGQAAIVRSRAVFSPQVHLAAWTRLIRRVGLQQAYRGSPT